ncbi:hypothetical protein A0H76_2907 [Hepatospora eriocheir]|uniref:Uncharacterized protein n=1 Tax=Hepatospora eriocheir TaxID=1081669 RepID=A0A1X0Q5I8_9MICR|nr:hypothetical protein A0H76_2907 [Hepatospora eriocheir]
MFVKEHQLDTIDYWKRIIWSKETKKNLFGLSRKVYIRRTRGMMYDKNYLNPTIKCGRKFNAIGLLLIKWCWEYRTNKYNSFVVYQNFKQKFIITVKT